MRLLQAAKQRDGWRAVVEGETGRYSRQQTTRKRGWESERTSSSSGSSDGGWGRRRREATMRMPLSGRVCVSGSHQGSLPSPHVPLASVRRPEVNCQHHPSISLSVATSIIDAYQHVINDLRMFLIAPEGSGEFGVQPASPAGRGHRHDRSTHVQIVAQKQQTMHLLCLLQYQVASGRDWPIFPSPQCTRRCRALTETSHQTGRMRRPNPTATI
jgi:hypothetical protein